MKHHFFLTGSVRALLMLGLLGSAGGAHALNFHPLSFNSPNHAFCKHDLSTGWTTHPASTESRATSTNIEWRTEDIFTMVVSADGLDHPATFRRLSVRSPGFAVLLQGEGGDFSPHIPGAVDTYLGTLDNNPDALAAAVILPDNTVFYQVVFTDGEHWVNDGVQTRVSKPDVTFHFPNYVPPQGTTASGLLKRVDVGVDMPHHIYNDVHNGDTERALRIVEYSLLVADLLYIRQVGIHHHLGRLVIRASLARDPYAPLRGDDPNCGVGNHCRFFDKVEEEWNGVLSGTEHMVMVLSEVDGGAGIANLSAIGTGLPGQDNTRAYSSNDLSDVGDFSLVWRHEAAHNWSVNHWDGGPPNAGPEGPTANSFNTLAKFSGSEAALIAMRRDSMDGFLQDIGPMTLPVPPHAATDSYLVRTSAEFADIPVLENDHDVNGEALQLLSVRRVEGDLNGAATVIESNMVRYTPTTQSTDGFDVFEYTIANIQGTRTARGLLFVSHVDFGNSYQQDFNAFPNGTTDLGDGSIITPLGEDEHRATVQDSALELTPDQLFQLGAFTVPMIGLEGSFRARFRFNVSGVNTPADAFAFNFGQRIPAAVSPRYHGFLRGVTIEFNTFSNPGFRVIINGVETAFVQDFDIANGQWQEVEIGWVDNRLSLQVDGELKLNEATDGFTPSSQDGMGFSAQTGGLSQRVLIDDIDILRLESEEIFADRFQHRGN